MEYLAHIREDGAIQTVKQHLEQTASLCSQYAGKIGCPSLGKLIGLLHDQGKFTKRFQDYIRQSAEEGKYLKKSNHSSAGGMHMMKLADWKGNATERVVAQMVAEAVCCHHSGLCDNLDLGGNDKFSKRIDEEQDVCYDETYSAFLDEIMKDKELLEMFQLAQKEVLNIREKIKQQGLELSFSLGMLEKFIFSCLIDADRLDTAAFMQNIPLPIAEDTQSLWEEFAKRLDNQLTQLEEESLQKDKEQQATQIGLWRSEISKACKQASERETGIYTLSCPTGSGKTLASMRYALHHAKLHGKERIFYIIPYTSIIDQNAQSIREKLSVGDNDELVNHSIIELHSALIREEPNRKKKDTEKTEEDKIAEERQEEYNLLSERMDAPVVLTTMVRFLQTFFGSGTRNIRPLHQFANAVILFDEIQTLPIKCTHMFDDAINFLTKICGATVVLCTATQPKLGELKRPVMFAEDRELVEITPEIFTVFKRVDIKTEYAMKPRSAEEITDVIFEKARIEKKVLAIMNTKASARELFEAIEQRNQEQLKEEQYILYFLTTHFCSQHRRDILKKIRDKLTDPNARVICVTTQLIEAGVDISFSSVFRALAGFDSVVQAAGRCNRHGEGALKEVILFDPEFEKLNRLADIQKGKNATIRLMNDFQCSPACFDHDLLSEKSIDTYFTYYFDEQKRCMDYTCGEGKKRHTLYDLLSCNPQGKTSYEELNQKKKYPFVFAQAFETAGEEFKAIDSETEAVIVPCGRGKQIIEKLNSSISLEEKRILLREAQQYSVNLFPYEKELLGNAVYPLYEVGAYALMDSYYDEKKGLCFESQEDGALFI